MATTHSVINVSTTAVRISPIPVHSGVDITVQNISETGLIYIGGPGVTTTDFGFILDNKAAISVELSSDCDLWAVASEELSVSVLMTDLEQGR